MAKKNIFLSLFLDLENAKYQKQTNDKDHYPKEMMELLKRREFFRYGERDPKTVIPTISLASINQQVIQHINKTFNIAVRSVPIRTWTPDEIKEGLGRYLNGEILLNPRFTDPKQGISADTYDSFFARTHDTKELHFDFNDANLRFTHIVEDIVTHEYWHHVFETYLYNTLKELYKRGHDWFAYEIVLHKLNEWFARWFHNAVAGHTDYTFQVDAALNPDDDEYYRDKDLILYAQEAISASYTKKGNKSFLSRKDDFLQIAIEIAKQLEKKYRSTSIHNSIYNEMTGLDDPFKLKP